MKINKTIKGVFKNETQLEKVLIILYFIIGLTEVVTEVYRVNYVQYAIKPLIAIIISILYWVSSKRRNLLFIINMCFLLIGRLYIIPNINIMLFYALIAIFFHRIIEIYYISKLIKLKDYIPPILASIPFLVFFLYLVSPNENVLIRSYVILMVQIILISLLSGIILSQYVLTFDKKSVWLFIFGLMSLMQTFIIFIEKFYLSDYNLNILRPSSLLLNTIVCYSFYKFVIDFERLKND